MIGKTIVAVSEEHYGENITLHFDDGSSTLFVGDEGCYRTDYDYIETQLRNHERQGERERQRLRRLIREEEEALSCEAWRERQSKKKRQVVMDVHRAGKFIRSIYADELQRELNAAHSDIAEAFNRMTIGTVQKRKHPCPDCGRLSCENAYYEVLP